MLTWAASAAAVVAALYLVVMRDFFSAYHAHSDDAGVILNSCVPYFAPSRWLEWFTRGWAGYAVNYPDWRPFGNNTMKPVVNLVFMIEGALASRLGQGAFLAMSYAAPVVTAFALAFAFRRLAKTTPAVSAALALVVATSAFWIGSLVNAVDMTNTLALMFSAIVLAMLPLDDASGSMPLQLGLVALQLLAIFSHETALVLAPVCVVLLFALSPHRPGWRRLWPFLTAPLLWGAVRVLVLQSRSGIYAFNSHAFARAQVWVYWLINSLLPIDVRGMWMARGFLPMHFPAARWPMALAVFVLIAINVAFVLFALGHVAWKRDTRSVLLALAFAFASAPHLTTAFDPAGARFAGLSMVVGLIACALLLEKRRGVFAALVGVVLAAQLVYAFTGLVEEKAIALAENRSAAQYSAYVHDAVDRAKPARVLVVNDRFGQYGVESLLRLDAWPYRDFDVVVIDNLALGRRPGGRVQVRGSGDTIAVDCSVEGDSTMSFLGADGVDFAVRNQGFAYTLLDGTEDSPRAFSAVGPVGVGKTLVIGHDPSDGAPMTPVIFGPRGATP